MTTKYDTANLTYQQMVLLAASQLAQEHKETFLFYKKGEILCLERTRKPYRGRGHSSSGVLVVSESRRKMLGHDLELIAELESKIEDMF